MSQKYDEYLENHRQAVKKAYQWIAAYIPELTDVEATRNIEFHDMSKNTPDEYMPYDDYFYGEQTPAVIEAFNRAWLMHIHRNPHHWQHWVLINDEPKEGTILIEMPYPYIVEMICDWWAFSWIKGDLSEMFAWYKDHADYIKLHNNTRSIVEEILEMIRTKLAEVENMTPNDYQQAALRTAPGDLPPEKLLLNGLMGLNGEAGEAIDILKKYLFQGHELDTAHMAKELGDAAWYLAVSANAIGYDLETIMQMNVDKLKARYPDGFDAEHSLHRNQDDI